MDMQSVKEIARLVQVCAIQAKALDDITSKMPEKVGQNEAADMAIEFKMVARAAKIAVARLSPTAQEGEK